MEKDIDTQEVITNPETEVEETIETTEDVDTEATETTETDLEAKVKELEDKNRKLYARLKRQEAMHETVKETPVKPKRASQEKDMSAMDLFALMKANVHEDDVETITTLSKVKGIGVSEVLKDPDMQAILKSRADRRKIADAANVTAARPSQKKVSTTELVSRAANGEIPAPGTPEAEELFWAKRGGKR